MTATRRTHATTNHRTHDRAEQIAAMAAEGLYADQMAERLGITPATLYGWARSHGVELPRRPDGTEGRKERIEKLVAEGLTRSQIADVLGLSLTPMVLWCKRHGVTLPNRRNPNWPRCVQCRRRAVASSRGPRGRSPAKHGKCNPCRREPITGGIVQHAFAFSRWTAYGIYGPTLDAVLEHFAWCCTCAKGGQADNRRQATTWAKRHNERNHA